MIMLEILSTLEPLPIQANEEPLLRAISTNNLDELRMLIKKHNISAQFRFSDGGFESLLHNAVIAQYAYPPQYINTLGARFFTNHAVHNIQPLHQIIQFLLIEFQVDPNQSNIAGKTPLHTAMTTFHLDTVNLLLQHGANPNITDNNGNTPLHDFAYNSERCMINGFKEKSLLALIKAGINPNLKNHEGKIAAHIAPNINVIIDRLLPQIVNQNTIRLKL